MTADEMERRGRELAAAILEVRRRRPYVQVDLDWHQIVIIVAQLQLALRHPKNRRDLRNATDENPARVTQAVIDRIIWAVQCASPEVAAALRMGNYESLDC